ncbi:MAG: UDP-N-acetylglucosamine 1-carboxyvinyltransferase [Candidatus Jorgensenbacteria bacterium GW2011_GWA1_48_11]|uniref:UDP-N-acetylglucosamine 1-carboxyvinyltransferase n=1 Tax=Candidatus Jorgensenbacteria bacterium GW2011_GWA1_48_11 TaxID=1618660 RepID=A0A0G1UBX2_9BACT|nr:MAG: UDP-N-acetylglucosamine 1-carboxyvinyltransferase [Candidatus Jorgensenbacteria bacterium GW2011_GWA1_48_11]KKW12148.1 MAG: UDP-N-acetylglucosamine 1-carboxyvinyltransferase [Candidatus Jorgensenbacteria bacterium GW2011_GWB1_49_9]
MSEQRKIGSFIKSLREARGLTQEEFAKALGTSQSAVARMERGGQNFTTHVLGKIGRTLEHKIVALTNSVDFKIEGGRKLHGAITTNSSKNGALGLLAASLINRAPTTLRGIPRIEEVNRFVEVLQSIGVKVEWIDKNSVLVTPPKTLRLGEMNNLSAEKIRSILMLIGGLIHRAKLFSIPHAGGCKMGNRTIAAHRYGLEALGVKIATRDKKYDIKVGKLQPAEITLYEASDTATENLLIAAAGIPGTTVISFATPNYQVQEVCFFLEALGIRLEGIGTSTLTVHGVEKIDTPIEYENSEDPIESMMFLSAAITTKSELTVKRCPIDFLKLELLKLEKMGLRYKKTREYLSRNRRTKLVDVTVYPSRLTALDDKIHAQPYPGINTDNLPFFVPIATQALGTTLIHDWMWENRAIYFTELNRLGAKVTLADPHRAFIQGPTPLKATQVVCPPALRPAMIILIAMLGAKGVSILRNVYSINRGYEEIAHRLNSIGARISVLSGV